MSHPREEIQAAVDAYVAVRGQIEARCLSLYVCIDLALAELWWDCANKGYR